MGNGHDHQTVSIARRLADWGGAISVLVFFVVGFKFVLDIRADFDAYVAKQTEHEANCARERQQVIQKVDRLIDRVDQLMIFYYRNTPQGETDYEIPNFSIIADAINASCLR